MSVLIRRKIPWPCINAYHGIIRKEYNAGLLSAFSVLIERRNETRIGAVEEH